MMFCMWQLLSDGECFCVLTSQWGCVHLPTSTCPSFSSRSNIHDYHHHSIVCGYRWIPRCFDTVVNIEKCHTKYNYNLDNYNTFHTKRCNKMYITKKNNKRKNTETAERNIKKHSGKDYKCIKCRIQLAVRLTVGGCFLKQFLHYMVYCIIYS